jgi:SAM-dependent methyltransferase
MSQGWSQGYVADIGYDHTFHREQTPQHLRLASLLSGVACDLPEEGGHLLELGCGQGMGAAIMAAANPSWRITAIDFSPAHIASARALAREAGITNLRFIEADLGGFAETPEAASLPPADVVTLHGVWSWVGPAVKAGILRLLHAKLRAGGVCHVSYNALPGWQNMLAMQRMVREAGRRLAFRSDRQAIAGLEVVRELAEAQAGALQGDARMKSILADLPGHSPLYLAHEFMNEHWQPCWHADVAGAMGEARLDFAGSAALLENFGELSMSAEQRALHDRFEDPLVRELVKDICLQRTLRHDIYVRGLRRLTAAQRDAALSELTLALVMPAERVKYEIELPAGKAELSPEFYGPVVQRLAKGPARVGDLLRLPDVRANRENPGELVGLLCGTRQAVALARPGAMPDETVLRLNAALARRLVSTENLNRGAALASHAIGSGVGVSMPELFMAARVLDGTIEGDVGAWASALGEGLDEENMARLTEALRRARESTVLVLRDLGCVPGAAAPPA